MSPDGTYNGYANYQTWNVCLWISNDAGLYNLASTCEDYSEFQDIMREVYPNDLAFETPDGVAWSDSGINQPEVQEFWQENFGKVRA